MPTVSLNSLELDETFSHSNTLEFNCGLFYMYHIDMPLYFGAYEWGIREKDKKFPKANQQHYNTTKNILKNQ